MSLTASMHTVLARFPIGDRKWLEADVVTPSDAFAVVVFAHGSASSRCSPRNRRLAAELNGRGLATVLTDLITPEEDAADQPSSSFRFDIPRLTVRMVEVIDWVRSYDLISTLPMGLFGASTGAAAAFDAAAARREVIRAIVSRGGRPDLASHLENVRAPSLLIVGEKDTAVLHMNCEARRRLKCLSELIVVPGATHLFEETGALESVASAASSWFVKHLGGTAGGATS